MLAVLLQLFLFFFVSAFVAASGVNTVGLMVVILSLSTMALTTQADMTLISLLMITHTMMMVVATMMMVMMTVVMEVMAIDHPLIRLNFKI